MLRTFFIIFSLILLLYLILPNSAKVEEFSTLPDAVKSNEPGDTYQVSNSAAYFTNYRRKDLMIFFVNAFNGRFSLMGISLPVIRLNHPPQYAQEVIRPYIQSWYLEEFIHPLRESLYVSGWEPFDEQGRRRDNHSYGIMVNGKSFNTKVNLRYITSPLWIRVMDWLMITLAIYFLSKLSKKVFNG